MSSEVLQGGTCDDLLTRRSEGSLGLLAFSGLEQSAIENCKSSVGTSTEGHLSRLVE